MFALVVLAAALTAVIPAQSYHLWKFSVVSTEWGLFLALIAMIGLLPGWSKSTRGRVAALLAASAIVLALSPIFRAIPVANALSSALGAVRPRSLTGATPQSRAFRLAGFFSMPVSPDVRMTTETYATRAAKRLEVDIYRREGAPRGQPLVILIHGGSWTGGTRADLPALNTYLAARGYVAASPSYRLSPEFRHPAQTEDINAVIDYLKTNSIRLGLDSTRIALIGRSAGGQLALISGYTKDDSSIRGVVAFYAPTDQRWGWENPTNPRVYDSFGTLSRFLGGSPDENPEGYRTASPIAYSGSHRMPTLLIHGSRDELVSVKQGARLDSALSRARIPHLFLELPWATHGCDYFFNGPCGQISTYAIERFLATVFR